MAQIISADRSIIPACDGEDLARYEEIVKNTHDIPQIGGYKIGATLCLAHSVRKVVETARKHTEKPLIYDHQKAGTDIPETATAFTKMLKSAGASALIIFPLAGPATQAACIKSAFDAELPVIVGGHMTHDRFRVSEGGYIDDSAIDKIYTNAASSGISHYVVPGNKPDVITRIRRLLEEQKLTPIFYAPGFISQGGKISEAATAAGPRWHAIIGRAIYEALDVRRAALSLTHSL